MKRTKFYTNLLREYQTCKLPRNKMEINWDTVEFLDADLRCIDRKKKIGKRVVVFIAKEQKTKKTVVFCKTLTRYSDTGTKALRKLMNELIKLGYRLRKAKTLAATILDLHNPNVDTIGLKLKTRLV